MYVYITDYAFTIRPLSMATDIARGMRIKKSCQTGPTLSPSRPLQRSVTSRGILASPRIRASKMVTTLSMG
jgi:hypothetical protein